MGGAHPECVSSLHLRAQQTALTRGRKKNMTEIKPVNVSVCSLSFCFFFSSQQVGVQVGAGFWGGRLEELYKVFEGGGG